MRKTLILLPLLLLASPAIAQSEPPIKLPPQLTDPAMADKLARTVDGLSKALLDVKVGEVEAAVEGRQATAAERNRTVGDILRRDDPNAERDLRRQVAEAGPKIAQGMKAISDAMPAIMKALDDAGRAIDRAAANMPDPTYPRR